MRCGRTVTLIAVSQLCVAEEVMDLGAFIEGSVAGLQMQTEAHDGTWGLGEADTWNVDQDTGVISWSFSDGKRVEAPVQIIGTYNPHDGSFMWGWDHPSINPALQAHARLVKAFGEEHDIPSYVTQKIVIDGESEAWEFVAVANRLAEANGGYRADAGGPLVFMTFGELKITKPSPD